MSSIILRRLDPHGTKISVEVNRFPEQCPFCHKFITPNYIDFYQTKNLIGAFLYCPNEQCLRTFIANYIRLSSNTFEFISTSFGDPISKNFSEQITQISNSFVTIYNEAYFAEQHNLLQICGVGYRKSLEFLIKDYSIINNPDKKEQIKKMTLANCIYTYTTDERVKNVASRAAWLGNDETHYVRMWENKDLKDLKKLIELTVHWIEMEILTKSFEEDMPR